METSQVGGQCGELTCKHPVLKHLGKWGYLKTSFILLHGHPWAARPEGELNASTTAAHLVIYFIAHRKQTFQLFAVIKPLPGSDRHH